MSWRTRFLSEQLLVETNHELLRHLETCPDCRADMAGRRAMRDGSVRHLRAPKACGRGRSWRRSCWLGSGLRQPGIIETIGAAIVVGARRRRGPGRRRRVVRAQLELAIAPGVALARDAAGDHQNCAVEVQSRRAADSARRRRAPLRCALRRPRDVRAASGRRTAGDCWSGMRVSIRAAASVTSCFATAAR